MHRTETELATPARGGVVGEIGRNRRLNCAARPAPLTPTVLTGLTSASTCAVRMFPVAVRIMSAPHGLLLAPHKRGGRLATCRLRRPGIGLSGSAPRVLVRSPGWTARFSRFTRANGPGSWGWRGDRCYAGASKDSPAARRVRRGHGRAALSSPRNRKCL